jgi:hypothetical protein
MIAMPIRTTQSEVGVATGAEVGIEAVRMGIGAKVNEVGVVVGAVVTEVVEVGVQLEAQYPQDLLRLNRQYYLQSSAWNVLSVLWSRQNLSNPSPDLESLRLQLFLGRRKENYRFGKKSHQRMMTMKTMPLRMTRKRRSCQIFKYS